MISTYDDDTLMEVLGEVLAPEPVGPGPEVFAALHQALATRAGVVDDATDQGALAAVLPFAPPSAVPTRRSATWAGLHRLRHPVAAAVAVGVLATSGVAAAGVATDHLPGPTRSVAFALGLPVTSPALEAARGTVDQLSVALAARDVTQVQASVARLRSQLDGLTPGDRAQIDASAGVLLTQAYVFLIAEAGSGSASLPGQTPSGGTGPGASGGSDPSGSTDSSGSSRSGTSSGSGSSDSGGTTSSDGGSTAGTSGSSGDSTPGTSGSSDGNSGGTGSGAGSGSGSTGTTDGPPQSTPGTTTPPQTTEPGDDGSDDGTNRSNTVTTQPGQSTGTAGG